MPRWIAGLLLAAALTGPPSLRAEPLRVAAAANYAPTLRALTERFTAAGGDAVEVISGSTGRLYAQIVNGAPFDLFFAADAERPARLVAEGRVPPEARFAYAVGRLALWSPDPEVDFGAGRGLLEAADRRLAVANPLLAPYGRAARELLDALDCTAVWRDRIVTGENVAQALHYVESGGADLGLVALSLVSGRGGSIWVVPDSLHAPIEQHAVILTDSSAARALADFVRSGAVDAVYAEHGYLRPEVAP